MSTFHPATSSLANFKNTISTISTSRFFIYISSRQEPTFVMVSQLELFLPANIYTTHLLSSTRATNEGIAVLEVWSIFPFAIKRILGIKRIFPFSFANKRLRLLTRVYGYLLYGNDCIRPVQIDHEFHEFSGQKHDLWWKIELLINLIKGVPPPPPLLPIKIFLLGSA